MGAVCYNCNDASGPESNLAWVAKDKLNLAFNNKNSIKGHTKKIVSVCISTSGDLIVVASTDRNITTWRKLHDLRWGREFTLKGHRTPIKGCVLSLNNKRIASIDENNETIIWSTTNGDIFRRLIGPKHFVCMNVDGSRLVSGAVKGNVSIWRTSDGQKLFEAREKERSGAVSCASFSNDNELIATGGNDRIVRLLEYKNDWVKERWRSRDHTGRITCISFSPDNMYIVSGSKNKSINLHSVKSGSCIYTLQGHDNVVTCCAWSSNSGYFVTGSSDGTMKIWQPNTQFARQTILDFAKEVTSCVFTPDDMFVVSGSSDGTVKIWDCQTGELFTQHENLI